GVRPRAEAPGVGARPTLQPGRGTGHSAGLVARGRLVSPPGGTSEKPPVVVLGYGSIGRRHAAAMAQLGHPLAIVNRGAEIRRRAAQEHPGAAVVPSIEALDEARFPWTDALAVIATWGPQHAGHLAALADRGVRRILCEKPMAASVADARAMARRAAALEYAGVNHTLRFAGLAPALGQLTDRHALGPPQALVVQGGAACLVTNGIHWLDFATVLFGGAPEAVVSTARAEPLNPRSPELGLYGGSAVWTFADARELVMTFSNRSSVLPRARAVYRNGVVEIGYVGQGDDSVLHASLGVRDSAADERYPQVTRTGAASLITYSGP